ncbi:MAG: flavin reductase family protein [Dehalococcoidia bacterium]
MAQQDVLSWFWAPLCAVGSRGPGGPNAQVCVSVFGASIVPDRPRVLVSLSKTNYTHDLVVASNTLAVSLLARNQVGLLQPLGLQSGRDGPKLAGLQVELTPAGDPWFPGAIGMLACEVIRTADHGDATAFLCAVTHRESFPGEPLPWAAARELVGEEFLLRWAEKSAREQAAARQSMLWP